MDRKEIWSLIQEDYDNKRFFDAYSTVADIAKNSEDTNLLYMQAFLSQKMNWHSLAIGYCDKILKFEPQNIEILKIKLTSCENLNFQEEIFNVCNQILKIIPNDPHSLLEKAKYLFKKKRLDECNKICTRLLNIETDKVEILEPILNFFEAFLRKHKEIIMICDKILAIDNKNISVYTKKAYSLLSIHEYKRAIITCNEILLQDNSNIMAILIKMNALEASGKYREVLKLCDKLLAKSNPDNISILPMQASMYAYLKDYIKSMQIYENIIRICESKFYNPTSRQQLEETYNNARLQLNILKINSNRKIPVTEGFDILVHYILLSLLNL